MLLELSEGLNHAPLPKCIVISPNGGSGGSGGGSGGSGGFDSDMEAEHGATAGGTQEAAFDESGGDKNKRLATTAADGNGKSQRSKTNPE